MESGFPPPQIDTSRPHPARLYNYYLGGKDNYPVDREAAAVLLRTLPEAREIARQNRLFMQRVVRHLVTEAGVRQIIDIGTGIPAAGNVHEVAHEIASFRDALAPGSYLALSHGTADFHVPGDVGLATTVYSKATAPLVVRDHQRVTAMFSGWDLIEPGVVQVPLWRPDRPASIPRDLAKIGIYGGVGRLGHQQRS